MTQPQLYNQQNKEPAKNQGNAQETHRAAAVTAASKGRPATEATCLFISVHERESLKLSKMAYFTVCNKISLEIVTTRRLSPFSLCSCVSSQTIKYLA